MRLSPLAACLLDKLLARQARTAVIGLGYVGLPLAVEFARAGFCTLGIDLDTSKVAAIKSGRSYIDDVTSEELAAALAAGKLTATADFDALTDVDTINICVPTPLRKTKDPDMSFIVAAAEQIAARLRAGMLVVLESTTYPGTTEELVRPILERSGLRAGKDFYLAFSPERIDPGNSVYNTRNVPKVVGGLTPDSLRLATALYEAAVDEVVQVSSPSVAEMVKLLENTFRAVNIGLVNELARMCDRLGIDVWEVVGAAATKPFGFMPFYPGPGLGGHCIPVDPFYLSWKARQSGFEARFIELAGSVNAGMPHYVLSLVSDALNSLRLPINGSRILVAGVAYKRDVDDIRESPALDLLALLHANGAQIAYSDPHVPLLRGSAWMDGVDLEHVDLTTAAPNAYDCIVIVTDHAAFCYDSIRRAGRMIVDTRNAITRPGPNVVRLGAPRPSLVQEAEAAMSSAAV